MQWHRELSWNPEDRTWRMAMLSMAGSLLFALGSFPPYSQLVDGRIVGITFVVGSVLFTMAAYTQFLEVINGTDGGDDETMPSRYWAWQPGRRSWWAALLNYVGSSLILPPIAASEARAS